MGLADAASQTPGKRGDNVRSAVVVESKEVERRVSDSGCSCAAAIVAAVIASVVVSVVLSLVIVATFVAIHTD